MYNLSVKEILNITNGKLICGDENEVCYRFSKNTKEIQDGDTFVGIKGENFDGSSLYKEALREGAKGCIINESETEKIEQVENKFIITVKDVILAIQNIAKYKREKYNIPVIAVTGSVGKTSTKDIIASVVSQEYKVLKTQGNMNNHIGLPMTILGLEDHTAMVVEMGMNHFGEISTLTNIANPTIVVITNIGTAHIGNLGSRENILKAKLEILEGLKENGKVVINNDNDLLNEWYMQNKDNYDIITYGINNKAIEKASNIEYKEEGSTYVLNEGKTNTKVEVPVGGEAFVYNSLAAISIGKILNIKMGKILDGILNFQLTKMRLDIGKTKNGCTIINDCYNANYDSMKSAIEYLKNIPGQRKIAILGDMLELGDYSTELHKNVGKVIAENKIDILITVGKESKNIADIAHANNIETYNFDKNSQAIEKAKEIIKAGDVILIKASNSMNFKEIVDAIYMN